MGGAMRGNDLQCFCGRLLVIIGKGAQMDRVRDILLYVVAAFAMFSFACSVYQAMNERNTSAGILAAIAVAGTLLVFFPRLELFKAFGIEARLVQTLDRADEVLEKLKNLSLISARATYMNMAFGNRMANPTAKQKQSILDQVDAQLSELKVTPVERRELTRPLVHVIGFDFFMFYVRVIDRFTGYQSQVLTAKVNKDQLQADRDRLVEWQTRVNAWRRRAYEGEPFQRLQKYDFVDEMNRIDASTALVDKDRSRAEELKEELIRLYKACEEKGGYTEGAAEFYDKYGEPAGIDRKIDELFGVNPSAER
jgi:hypothetical protein